MPDDKMYGSVEEGERSAKKVLSGIGNATGSVLKSLIPPKYFAIFIGVIALFLLVVIVAQTANGVLGGSIPIIPRGVRVEKLSGLITDKNTSINNIEELTSVIRARQKKDYDACIEELRRICYINDLDFDMSMSFLNTETVITYADEADQNLDDVIEEVKIPDALNEQKRNICARPQEDYPVHSDITKVPNRFSKTTRGLFIFATGVSSSADYIAAMPSYFGPVGSRFKITDSEGNSVTILKGSNIADEKTYNGLGRYASEDAIFYLIGTEDMWPSYRSSVNYILGIKNIDKIERLHSQFSSVTVIQSGSDLKLLSAFSVSIGNGQLTREDTPITVPPEPGPTPGVYYYPIGAYEKSVFYNNKGEEVKGLVINNGGINYIKTLENKLAAYKGAFYSLDYDRDGNEVHVYEHIEYETVYTEVWDEARERYYTKIEQIEHITKYCNPVLKERSFYSVALEAFELNLNDIYVNSCQWEEVEEGNTKKMVPVGTDYITNLDAVNQMTRTTSALLYNSGIGSGVIINSDFSGAFEWPMPTSRYVTCPFGYRTGLYAGFHNAIDISCPAGSQVVSPEAGIVISTGYDYAGGNFMYIQFDNGWAAEFMHLSSFVAHEGQRVQRGEVVALSGNTGAWTTGAHLHFMLWDPVLKNWTDPLPYVVKNESEIIRLY